MHVHKPNMFFSANITNYSEEDFKLKFWSHVFEELFGYSNCVLRWGDTVPKSFKNTEIVPKMDLRIITSAITKNLDLSVVEFAKQGTANKLYIDKLKMILVSKFHLNYYIKKEKAYPFEVFVPFLQVMGLEC
ncbi:MAG: hypothetical protein EXX96DRAFT_572521 [Benjaminiella poitrasii]|nr:MAG: hypothetical protein EXX96DRAFT_572521 [Benjaminiella poitrasii]